MRDTFCPDIPDGDSGFAEDMYQDYPEYSPVIPGDSNAHTKMIPGETPYKGFPKNLAYGGEHQSGGEPGSFRGRTPGTSPYMGPIPGETPYGVITKKHSAEAGAQPRKIPGEPGAIPRNSPGNSPIRTIDAVALMEQKLPPRKLIINPWLHERGLAMIYAARGVGKTFFALEMALGAATGTPFLGWHVEKPVRVLYIDGEMSMIDIQQRLLKMERGRRDQLPGMINFITPEMQEGPPPDLSQPGWHRRLEPLVQEVDLIIVDNISTLCRSGNENDAESWQVVQLWAIQQKSAGRSVVFIHHAGKGGQQRGTSKREDVMDTVIALKRPEDYTAAQGARFEVHFEKARGFSGDEAKSFVVQLQQEGDQYHWLCDKVAESQYEQAVGMLKNGMAQKDVSIELSVDKSTVSRWAGKAKIDGRL